MGNRQKYETFDGMACVKNKLKTILIRLMLIRIDK